LIHFKSKLETSNFRQNPISGFEHPGFAFLNIVIQCRLVRTFYMALPVQSMLKGLVLQQT